MKTLIIILILFSSSLHAVELKDYRLSFDDRVEDIIINADKNIKYKLYKKKLWYEQKSWGTLLIQGFGGLDTKIYSKFQKVPEVIFFETTKEKKDSLTKEIFAFCENSGKLIQYRHKQTIPVEKVIDIVFDKSSRLFVGYDEGSKIINSFFYKGITGFDWIDDNNVTRNSYVKKFKTTAMVSQTFLDTSEYELCSTNHPKRDIDLKDIKPMGLENYFSSTRWLIRAYEDTLYMYSQCENFFPDLKITFDEYWSEYEEKNTKIYLEAKIKLQKVFAKINNNKLENEFNENFIQAKNYFKKTILDSSKHLTDEQNKENHYKSCTGWLSGEVKIFGEKGLYSDSINYILE